MIGGRRSEPDQEDAMRMLKGCTSGVLIVSCAAAVGCRGARASGAADTPRAGREAEARVAFTHTLPRLDGDHLRATIVEVTYPPGGSSPPHSHPCAVIGYVIQGALRTRVQGDTEAVYHAGESFYEAPNGVHAVSANASDRAPARFLAYFTCDRETPLTVPAREAHR
jgi:quercetin dioxygenase-like cupin family protein